MVQGWEKCVRLGHRPFIDHRFGTEFHRSCDIVLECFGGDHSHPFSTSCIVGEVGGISTHHSHLRSSTTGGLMGAQNRLRTIFAELVYRNI